MDQILPVETVYSGFVIIGLSLCCFCQGYGKGDGRRQGTWWGEVRGADQEGQEKKMLPKH